MKKQFLAAGVLTLTALLVACGGGGGGGGYTPPTGNPSASPTPTPTPTPSTVKFSGSVTQLAGSLAHMTGSCQTATGQCPTPPATIPAAPSPTPVPGSAIAGATVFVTTAAGVFTNATPNPVLATATTAPDGTFTTPALQVSAFGGGKAAIVVLNGSSVSPTTGVTDKGYAVLHTEVAVSGGNVTVPNLEIDTLSTDEAAGAPEIENVRKNKGLAPTAIDEYALEAVRWSVQNNDGAGSNSCAISGQAYTLYSFLGGIGTPSIVGDIANPTLAGAIDVMYQNPSANEVWGTATGPVGELDCGGRNQYDAYYQMMTITQ